MNTNNDRKHTYITRKYNVIIVYWCFPYTTSFNFFLSFATVLASLTSSPLRCRNFSPPSFQVLADLPLDLLCWILDSSRKSLFVLITWWNFLSAVALLQILCSHPRFCPILSHPILVANLIPMPCNQLFNLSLRIQLSHPNMRIDENTVL